MNKLTDTMIRNLKNTSKVQKLSDGGGLYLFVPLSGGNFGGWVTDSMENKKTLSFGAYPAVSLKDARQKREEAKEQLARGIDPGEQKKEAKAVAVAAAREQAATFEAVAREWFARKTTDLTPGHRKKNPCPPGTAAFPLHREHTALQT